MPQRTTASDIGRPETPLVPRRLSIDFVGSCQMKLDQEQRRRREFVGLRLPIPLVVNLGRAAQSAGVSRNRFVRVVLEAALAGREPGSEARR